MCHMLEVPLEVYLHTCVVHVRVSAFEALPSLPSIRWNPVHASLHACMYFTLYMCCIQTPLF